MGLMTGKERRLSPEETQPRPRHRHPPHRGRHAPADERTEARLQHQGVGKDPDRQQRLQQPQRDHQRFERRRADVMPGVQEQDRQERDHDDPDRPPPPARRELQRQRKQRPEEEERPDVDRRVPGDVAQPEPPLPAESERRPVRRPVIQEERNRDDRAAEQALGRLPPPVADPRAGQDRRGDEDEGQPHLVAQERAEPCREAREEPRPPPGRERQQGQQQREARRPVRHQRAAVQGQRRMEQDERRPERRGARPPQKRRRRHGRAQVEQQARNVEPAHVPQGKERKQKERPPRIAPAHDVAVEEEQIVRRRLRQERPQLRAARPEQRLIDEAGLVVDPGEQRPEEDVDGGIPEQQEPEPRPPT